MKTLISSLTRFFCHCCGYKRETTTNSDLPPDLVEEILCKVPATSLKRLRYTCKRWNNLFRDKKFIEKHLLEAPKQVHVLMYMESRVCNVNLNQNVVAQFMGELDLKVSHSRKEQVDIAQVFHCDGLLLCTTKDNKLVVWNPCLGETRWIQPKPSYHYYIDSMLSLGYQNKKSCRSYKILSCWDRYDHNQQHRFEIYEFSSDSWRCLDETALDYFFILLVKGVSLKGNTIRIAMDREGQNKCVLFDFTTERFKLLSFPEFQNAGYVMDLSVVRDENLLVLNQCFYSKEVEIWVTKKFDDTQAALSWSKYCTVDLQKINRNLCPITVSVVIYEEKKVVLCSSDGLRMSMDMVYITGEDDAYFTEIDYAEVKSRNQVWSPFIFNYLPSLVHI